MDLNLLPRIVYDTIEDDIINHLGKWYTIKDIKNNDGVNVYNEITTVVMVDEDSSYHLYNRIYNPLSIFFGKAYFNKEESKKRKETSEQLFDLKIHLYSIDDSSYGAWFYKKNINDIYIIREKLVKYITDTMNSNCCINGEEMLTYCKHLNCDDVDYN